MSAGKGDTPRPVDPKKYGESYDRIFKRGLESFGEMMKNKGFDWDNERVIEQRLKEIEMAKRLPKP